MVRRLGTAALLLFTAGCYWPVPGHDANRSGYAPTETAITPANVGQLEVKWRVAPTSPEGFELLGMGSPVISQHGVHVTGTRSDDMDVALLRSDDGQVVWWKEAMSRDGHYASADDPWVVGDLLVTGGYLAQVSGEDRQVVPFPATFDAATGERVTDVGIGPVAAARGTLVVTQKDGSGALGDVTQPGAPPAWISYGDAFILGSDRIYSATRGGVVRAVPLAGGRPVWESYVLDGEPQPLVLDPGQTTVFVAGGSVLSALGTSTGAARWSVTFDAHLSAPALADGVIYVTTDSQLTALDAATGAELWRAHHDNSNGRIEQPVIAGDLVFLPSTTVGTPVRAFAADGCGAPECPALWNAPHNASAVAVSGGVLYTTGGPYVTAYALPTEP